MSNRERRKCRIGGTLSAVLAAISFLIGIAANSSGLLVSGAVMAIVSISYWIPLARNPAPATKTSKEETAVAAEAIRERAKAEQLQRELLQQARKAAYLEAPVPLQIRQWRYKGGWEDGNFKKELNAPMYIYSMGLSDRSMDSRNQAVIYQQDGAWYVKPLGFGTMCSINDAAARSKCQGLPVNDREIRILEPCVLLPGDCLKVTSLSGGMAGVPGSADTYFRIEERTGN